MHRFQNGWKTRINIELYSLVWVCQEPVRSPNFTFVFFLLRRLFQRKWVVNVINSAVIKYLLFTSKGVSLFTKSSLLLKICLWSLFLCTSRLIYPRYLITPALPCYLISNGNFLFRGLCMDRELTLIIIHIYIYRALNMMLNQIHYVVHVLPTHMLQVREDVERC